MSDFESSRNSSRPLLLTLTLSALAAGLFVVWLNHLDPARTGGSILAMPVILVGSLLCIPLFWAGLWVSTQHRAGRFMMLGAILIPVAFFVIDSFFR